MYTRILVPLDGSRTAEAVLPYARLLAGELRIPVELLTVIDVIETSRELGPEHYLDFDAAIKDQVRSAEKSLSGIAKSFEGENVSCSVEKGITAGTILSKCCGRLIVLCFWFGQQTKPPPTARWLLIP